MDKNENFDFGETESGSSYVEKLLSKMTWAKWIYAAAIISVLFIVIKTH